MQKWHDGLKNSFVGVPSISKINLNCCRSTSEKIKFTMMCCRRGGVQKLSWTCLAVHFANSASAQHSNETGENLRSRPANIILPHKNSAMMQPKLHKSTFSVDVFHANSSSGARYLQADGKTFSYSNFHLSNRLSESSELSGLAQLSLAQL